MIGQYLCPPNALINTGGTRVFKSVELVGNREKKQLGKHKILILGNVRTLILYMLMYYYSL